MQASAFRTIPVLCTLLFFLMFSARAAHAESAPGAEPSGVLRLRAVNVDPLRSAAPRSGARAEDGGGGGVRIVQVHGRAGTPEVHAALARAGARIVGFLPENAYVVRAAGGASALRAVPGLRWEGPVRPEWKLAPDLGTRPFVDPARRAGGRLLAHIELWAGADADAVSAQAAALGLEVRAVWTDGGRARLLARGPLAALAALARLEDVAFIEEYPEATPRNDAASWVVQSYILDQRPLWGRGLHGEGQIVGVIDGRLDMNSCYFSDGGPPGPSHRKVVAYRSASGQGADSHGTHVSGTVAGDSGTPNAWNSGDGHAFAARISFSNLSDIDGSGGSPSNLAQYLSAAHADGARVHTNSWGDDGTTSYTSWCRDIDDFSWQNEDSVVLFAATNTSSLRTPENAKNVLAVGASQRAGDAANFCSGGAGPTSDGRRKPEIFAPGCSTVSAASGQSCGTRSLTGTSMASPAVAGAAALVRQYYADCWYPTGTPVPEDALVPSGALLRATLLAGTVDMTGIGGFPSNQEGWGRTLLENSLYFEGDARGLVVLADRRRADGLQTAGAAPHALEVSGGEPLRLVLVFTDAPAALLAADARVNDLDLKVTAPDGQVYWGNRTDGSGSSIPGGTPDAKNTVEIVLLPSPVAGTYTVEVLAPHVPQGPQGFALVATGGVRAVAPGVRLTHADHSVNDAAPLGNGDGVLDPGETATIPAALRNAGGVDATGVSARLAGTPADLLRVTDRDASFPDIARGTSAGSLAPHFTVTLDPAAACGDAARFTVTSTSSESPPQDSGFQVEIGNPNRDYGPGAPKDLAPRFLGVVESKLTVPDAETIAEIDVSVDITHGNIGELLVVLVSPSGRQVNLHNRTRAGTADLKLRYDRDRAPDGPGSLADFAGESAQGTWRLAVNDNVQSSVPGGRVNGWTLHLTANRPLTCNPLACADPRPGAVSGLRVARDGADLHFEWNGAPGADGYHVLASADRFFAAPEVTGTTSGATVLDAPGAGAVDPAAVGPSGALTWYQVRATNACRWEGP